MMFAMSGDQIGSWARTIHAESMKRPVAIVRCIGLCIESSVDSCSRYGGVITGAVDGRLLGFVICMLRASTSRRKVQRPLYQT